MNVLSVCMSAFFLMYRTQFTRDIFGSNGNLFIIMRTYPAYFKILIQQNSDYSDLLMSRVVRINKYPND